MIIEFEVKGRKCLIDDIDADLLSLVWGCQAEKRTTYVRRGVKNSDGKKIAVMMHRVIMERVLGRPLSKGEDVDHIDTDGLNNTRANLRVATRSQNKANSRVHLDSRTGFKGVTYRPDCRNHYQAQIQINGVKKHLGRFETPEQANAAYVEAAKEAFGDFARGA
jgi:hypothetical protein